MRSRIDLVVPCYNESSRLNVDSFLEFLEEAPMVNFCFVNDGSTDSTGEILESLHRMRPDRVGFIDLDLK